MKNILLATLLFLTVSSYAQMADTGFYFKEAVHTTSWIDGDELTVIFSIDSLGETRIFDNNGNTVYLKRKGIVYCKNYRKALNILLKALTRQ